MRTLGLFIGIDNYPGTGQDLSGCVNDANAWAAKLAPVLDAATLLVNSRATYSGITRAMRSVLGQLAAGDLAVICYSGHGSWIPDTNGDEADGRDEVLVPYDFAKNLVVDDELRQILVSRETGSRVLFVSDSCHSGTVFRLLGPATARKMRFLPPSYLGVRAAAAEPIAARPRLARVSNLPGVIHLSGCRDHEYSYEAVDKDGKPCGAMSLAALTAYESLRKTKGSSTYAQWFAKISKQLPTWDYPQTPMINAYAAEKRLVVPGLDSRSKSAKR